MKWLVYLELLFILRVWPFRFSAQRGLDLSNPSSWQASVFNFCLFITGGITKRVAQLCRCLPKPAKSPQAKTHFWGPGLSLWFLIVFYILTANFLTILQVFDAFKKMLFVLHPTSLVVLSKREKKSLVRYSRKSTRYYVEICTSLIDYLKSIPVYL